MTSTPDHQQIAASLVGGQPLAYKAYPDGSLVVIAPSGQKCSFSAEEVAAQSSALVKTPAVKKPAARRGTTAKVGEGTSGKGTP